MYQSTYTLSYYEGEEREVPLNKEFPNVEAFLRFITDTKLHPDYLMVTEWEDDEIVQQVNALYFYY